MKRMSFNILVAIFCFLSTTTIAQTRTSTKISAKKSNSSLSGAWHSVDNKEFLIMSDGFFSSIAKDSTGNWTETYAGTYTIDNANTITLKATHSSFAYRIGYLHTIEYNLTGDNLTFKLYKKLIDPKAGDMTARMPKDQQTQYVRARQ
jgi:hypothetical protein